MNNTMDWLGSNSIWLALGAGALAFFSFGRGGCEMGHGGHDHHRRREPDQYEPTRESSVTPHSTPTARLHDDDIAAQPGSQLQGAAPLTEGALTMPATRSPLVRADLAGIVMAADSPR